MKKTQLIIGIVLMILGLGLSVGSVALHGYELSARHRIATTQGVKGGNGFRVPNQRRFYRTPKPNNGQNPNQSPKQAPNQGSKGNGGINQ